jgi:translation initiation factor 2B subunit (eIF-2B alpha/beta/delta family)
MSMTSRELEQMLTDIAEDLTSGAAELALRAINIYRHIVSTDLNTKNVPAVRAEMVEVSRRLIKSQPAIAPLFNLANEILFATDSATSLEELAASTVKTADQFENRLCNSAASIAEATSKLVPFGETVFAYSFSSTVVSSLLNAKQQKPFRVVCTESRPSFEGRKLANMLASAGVEVTFTFDSAMGMLLPSCRVAFMGVDAVARPGIVNKVGSWLLTLACRELKIPVFALAGTEKFVTDDLLFSFEDHERPGNEVWDAAPQGVRAINRQFELIPFDWIAGLVTEEGILRTEQDVEPFVDRVKLHPELQSYAMSH